MSAMKAIEAFWRQPEMIAAMRERMQARLQAVQLQAAARRQESTINARPVRRVTIN